MSGGSLAPLLLFLRITLSKDKDSADKDKDEKDSDTAGNNGVYEAFGSTIPFLAVTGLLLLFCVFVGEVWLLLRWYWWEFFFGW